MSIFWEIETWLRAEYKKKLGLEIGEKLGDPSVVVWRGPNAEDESLAHLYDQDLGAWFQFVQLADTSLVRKEVEERVQKSLGESSQLLWKSGLQKEAKDPNGAWTINLVFLVHSTCRGEWEKTMQGLRAGSGFTEELTIDLIVYSDAASFKKELTIGDAFPGLMLATRSVLKLTSENIDSWRSANLEVAELLKELPNRFPDESDQRLVISMVERTLSDGSVSNADSARQAVPPRGTAVIKNLRNISDFTLQLADPEKKVVAKIIHGPNGTGKSSIFEALSFAIAGTSRRMVEYLTDADISRANAQGYVENVLTPLENVGSPSVEYGGGNVFKNLPADVREADRRLLEADGTLLAQEDARSFVETQGKSLGSRVLSGYSNLAQGAQLICEREFQAANLERQTWLRQFGINAAVRREESRLIKLIEYFLGKECPYGSQQIIFWLQAVKERVPSRSIEVEVLIQKWSDLDGQTKRAEVAKNISQLESLGASEECERSLRSWMTSRQRVLENIKLLGVEMEPKVNELLAQRVELEEDLKKWKEWLNRPKDIDTPVVSLSEIETTEKALNLRLAELRGIGIGYADHLSHLNQVRGQFLVGWSTKHPDICPTCGADHADEGGIVAVVNSLIADLTVKIDQSRKEYAGLLARLRESEKSRSIQGQCPVTEERRSAISGMLEFDPEGYEVLQARLNQSGLVESILQSIDTLIARPTLQIIDDLENAAARIWSSIEAENARGAALWDLPDRWQRIQNTVDKECMLIIQRHLPRTLQAVWAELTMVLTPARWNLAGQPRMIAESKRGNENLRVVVGGGKRQIGVRHIFNQAENHVLGLAWFFTRYLSAGRFRQALIALDDPAQEMDQTTFRGFTRLLQTLCRLHERYELPLTLVLLLHQEDRALDAARATNHQLTSLKWAKKISSHASVENLILLGPDFSAPLPKYLQTAARKSPSDAGIS